MKKTCFALALLGALNLAYGQGSTDEQALADLQDAVTLTFSNAANTSEGSYAESKTYFISFTLGNNLDTNRVTTTATQGGNPLTTIPTFSAVELQSIALKTSGTNWYNFGTKAYIADQATKTVVAISDTTIPIHTVTGGDTVTFDFTNSNTILSSNTTYLLLFVNHNITPPAVGASAIANTNGILYSNKRGYATIGNGLNTDTSSQLGFCDSKGVIQSTANSPIMTITTKNVPEPSVAVLGLLALGGLAARRRRK